MGERNIKRAAMARGLDYLGRVYLPRVNVQTLNESFDAVQVARSTGEASVYFGNHGDKWLPLSGESFKPLRRGFVFLEHGTRLPRMAFTTSDIGAITAKNVVSVGLTATLTGLDKGVDTAANVVAAAHVAPVVGAAMLFNKWTGKRQGNDGEGQPVPESKPAPPEAEPQAAPGQFRSWGELKHYSTPLHLPRRSGFDAWCEESEAARGQELMTPEAVDILSWLSRSFDVEVNAAHIGAHCNYGDLSTDEDEVWDWAFSVASRLIDFAGLWGSALTPRSLPQYTEERIRRPKDRDGGFGFLKKG